MHAGSYGTLFLAILVLASACHPKPGTRCDPRHEGQCRAPDLALFCTRGVWTLYPCKGPDGCEEWHRSNLVVCDMRHADGGDACSPDVEGYWACGSEQPREVLQCVSGVFEVDDACPDGTVCTLLRFDDGLECAAP